MSEPMFPTVDGPERPVAVEPDGSGGRNRKALFAVGGAVGALALGAGAFVLLTGSGGGADEPSTSAAPNVAVSAPAPVASPSPAVVTIKTVSVAARDPFAVLFPAPKPAPVAPVAPVTANQAPGTTTTTPVVTPPTKTVMVSVSAVNPTKQTATVSIDGTKYAATIGKVFAKTFVLYSVFNAQCVGVLFGDQSVPVCTNTPQTVSP